MTSFFYRITQRSPPSVATAATTATVAAVTFSKSGKSNDISGPNVDDGPSDGLRRGSGFRSNGVLLFGNESSSYKNFPLYSTASFLPVLGKSLTLCEESPPPALVQQKVKEVPSYKPSDPAEPTTDPVVITNSDGEKVQLQGGMWGEEEDGMYHGLFPRRQLWRPRLEYPLWDNDWDQRRPPPIDKLESEEGEGENSKPKMTEAQRDRYIRKKGVTKHIILIRHGQYDESHPEDSKRLLTPLGRKQAELTGVRLGKLIRGVNEEFGPCRVKVVRVSDLARAKETADIIYDNMGVDNDFDGEAIEKGEPDPLLNEGRPCHHIPGGRARASVVKRTDEHHPRIEQAFRKYFFRADMPDLSSVDEEKSESVGGQDNASPSATEEGATEKKLKTHPQHEFEIIVCHANVIRYFFCRALQLPPEAWLRLCTFNCSLTYFTIRPTGTVSCRMLGDIGHLPHELSTFSMHTGFNW
mmetsp:Transcript_25396/g.53108  ORF Transcript_25396/g.53108 Transcript_25396/m.53108 type:complete len:468 (+) Transcript_25396:63-1466(+)